MRRAADRREQERQIEVRAEDGGPQIGARREHGVARAERDGVEDAAVVAQRDLVLGAAVGVVEDDARQPALGEAPQVGDVDGLGDAADGHGLPSIECVLDPDLTEARRAPRT